MDPESIKPAGMPSTEPMATPPPSADPMLAPQNSDLPEEKPVKKEDSLEKEDKKQPEPVKAKKPNNNQSVALAIIATIIIVLGIAALAVYAYLKQH
jgi:hypothetical protein